MNADKNFRFICVYLCSSVAQIGSYFTRTVTFS
jgi:hypothetical protein